MMGQIRIEEEISEWKRSVVMDGCIAARPFRFKPFRLGPRSETAT